MPRYEKEPLTGIKKICGFVVVSRNALNVSLCLSHAGCCSKRSAVGGEHSIEGGVTAISHRSTFVLKPPNRPIMPLEREREMVVVVVVVWGGVFAVDSCVWQLHFTPLCVRNNTVEREREKSTDHLKLELGRR